MKPSLIFQTVMRPLHWILVLTSLLIYYRGHNDPGGGFVGGLVIGTSYSLLALAFGLKAASTRLRFPPETFIGLGLFLGVTSATISLFLNQSFMTSLWGRFAGMDWGTPQLFDLGVYFVVLGMVTRTIFSILEDSEE